MKNAGGTRDGKPTRRPRLCVDCGRAREPEREAAGKWRCGQCAKAADARRIAAAVESGDGPRTVTWCSSCHRVGVRQPDEPIDTDCRYCWTQSSIQQEVHPTAAAAFEARDKYKATHTIDSSVRRGRKRKRAKSAGGGISAARAPEGGPAVRLTARAKPNQTSMR